MNEWGIPDWRDPNAYGDTTQWNKLNWRWEFIRRRDDYREDFLKSCRRFNEEMRGMIKSLDENRTKYVEALKEYQKELSGPLRQEVQDLIRAAMVPSEDTEKLKGSALSLIVDESHPDSKICLEKSSEVLLKYRINPLQNPKKTPFEPRLEIAARLVGIARYFPGLASTDSFPLGEGEVAYVFNTKFPIEKQISSAKHMLERIQKSEYGHLARPREHPNKWFLYLRVLDAREANQSWAVIADTLFSPDAEPQKARDVHKQALAQSNRFLET